MKTLIIAETKRTPEIILNSATNTFLFSGKSLPEDAKEFYKPVLDWIDEYFKFPNRETVFNFNLEYLNSASVKLILEILIKIKSYTNRGYYSTINWYYDLEDEDSKESALDLASLAMVHLNMLERELIKF